jgi:hypothetical protein
VDSEQREYLLYGESIMLVKLTEVCDNGAVTNNKMYSLREVFINPEHVVMIREEKRLQELNERGKVAAGLNETHQFSKLTINRGQAGTEIIVVGAPEIVEGALKNNKQLLRG